MTFSAHALAYGFRGQRIGSDVTLDIAPGQVLALLGPNGGGKTTLLKTLLGLTPPQAGRITLDGQDLAAIAIQQRARLIGYVPQSQKMTFAFTVRELVLMGRTAHGGLFSRPSAKDHAVCDMVLAMLGIGFLAERPTSMVSGGELQLALIARAMAQEPRYIVLDEPTASLDFGNQGKVMRQLRRLADEGLGVLFTTHDPNQALQHADNVAMLRGGDVIARGPTRSILTTGQLEALYHCPILTVEGNDGGLAFLPG